MVNKLAYILKKGSLKLLEFFNDRACKNVVKYNTGVKFLKGSSVFNIAGVDDKIQIGKNSKIKGELLIFPYGGEILIGENVFIGDGSKIWSGESVKIGNDVLISHSVNIIDTNSHEMDHIERAQSFQNLIKNGHPKNKGSIITAPIVINDNAWISFGVSILKGVTVGKGAIIAAGSVVTKDVKPFTIVAGNPANEVKKLKLSHIHE